MTPTDALALAILAVITLQCFAKLLVWWWN